MSREFLFDEAEARADGVPLGVPRAFGAGSVTSEPGYDREWVEDLERGKTRLRRGLTTERGVPVRFLVQLEYRLPDDRGDRQAGDWCVVARFDHDTVGPAYRDVESFGLHMDVYHPSGVQRFKKTDFPPQPANEALPAAERYLRAEHERLVRRFERWL